MKKIEKLSNKKVLMVLSHCDDEIVCGWPILQDSEIEKEIIIISSDKNSSSRKWCAHRKYVTHDLCKILGINVTVLDYESEFFRIDHRSGKLLNFEMELLNLISEKKFDYLFTHNPHGEYGHLDHIFVFNLLIRFIDSPIIISDIIMKSDWTSICSIGKIENSLFYRNLIGSIQLNEDFFNDMKNFYIERNAWTWAEDPPHKCGLFLL